MENEPIIQPTPFLAIRDSKLNVKEIIAQIESRIPLPPPTNLEWERISKMQFQPESPEGYRKFDPAGTATLFERGISPPKFTNPKLWFIKGPIKYLFTRLIEFYSLVDKKLSENRIKAFFSVLHELIRLTKRIQNIEVRLEKFYTSQILKNSTNIESGEFDFGWSTYQYFDQAGKVEYWETAIADLKNRDMVSVIFPAWGQILKDLTVASIPFNAFTNIESEANFIKHKISSNIKLVNRLFPLTDILSSENDIIVSIPLNRFPVFLLEKLFASLTISLSPGKYLYFSIQTKDQFNSSPFQDINVSHIDISKLPDYLYGLGFVEERDLTHHEFYKIFRYTKSV